MSRMATADRVVGNDRPPDGYDLEHQLRIAEKHYADARRLADTLRDEWRSLAAQGTPCPERVNAARAKFDAVAARCRRLLNMIDELEDRLDG